LNPGIVQSRTKRSPANLQFIYLLFFRLRALPPLGAGILPMQSGMAWFISLLPKLSTCPFDQAYSSSLQGKL
jgi:hypothetical protein